MQIWAKIPLQLGQGEHGNFYFKYVTELLPSLSYFRWSFSRLLNMKLWAKMWTGQHTLDVSWKSSETSKNRKRKSTRFVVVFNTVHFTCKVVTVFLQTQPVSYLVCDLLSKCFLFSSRLLFSCGRFLSTRKMFKRKLTSYQGSWIEPLQSLMSLYLGFVHILDLKCN